MLIRKARREDLSRVRELAEGLGLDYPGLEDDVFWIGEDNGRIEGICGLKKHPDCLELCALGVEKSARGRRIGCDLVRTLLREVKADIFLATVIPGFFERLGFSRTPEFPRSMEKGRVWCEGCDRAFCTVMVKRAE
jgi:N-acetylglutamate synthase-like GNAT family acetyltransferase